jgi:hypothetical protein
MEEEVRLLHRIRHKVELFMKDKHWELYVNSKYRWDLAVFDPEQLQAIAEEVAAEIGGVE